MKEINLTSRYNNKYKLIHTEGDWYKADFEDMCEWVRFGGDGNDNLYDFVDPPGGPFLHIGDILNCGLTIKSIKINNGIYLELKDETNNN